MVMSEIVIVNASSGRAACFAVKEGAGWISAYETSMIASLFSAVSFLVTLKEMTPAVLVSMSVIQLSLHLADRVAFATGFSIVYSIWKGPPSAGTSRLSLANTISGCASGVTGSSLLHPAKSEEPKIPPPEDHQQPYESKIFHSIKGFSAGPTAGFYFRQKRGRS